MLECGQGRMFLCTGASGTGPAVGLPAFPWHDHICAVHGKCTHCGGECIYKYVLGNVCRGVCGGECIHMCAEICTASSVRMHMCFLELVCTCMCVGFCW